MFTHLDILHIVVAQCTLGQFEPAMFVVDGRETLLVLSTLHHGAALDNIVQMLRHFVHFGLKGFAAGAQRQGRLDAAM